ncbi:hypothetical protein MH117_22155 [Paenibacillus sp. ACRRX]|uniref:hypothetical protein n=1 Tax=unclassified Paenibacillus TaxID=185978 RepID=UPI001EF71C71|nr:MULTISPECIES: hypothetical protein [unclassified Paenibacillus]MCG7410121.1 hypothetical protein [Paenibacillus sp. ACRRX]MDK8183694.1 hypothetical protein [Paenibacillus sp. UMB4589-SE434]
MWERSYQALQVKLAALFPEVSAWYVGSCPESPARPAIWVQLMQAEDERTGAWTLSSAASWQIIYVPAVVNGLPDGMAQLRAAELIRSDLSRHRQLSGMEGDVFDLVSVKGGTRSHDTFVRVTLAAEEELPQELYDQVKRVSVHYEEE